MHISRATPNDVERCADILAHAFYDDPVFALLFPIQDRLHRLRRFFVADLRVSLRGGQPVDVARLHGGGRPVGVAVWSPPGRNRRLVDVLRSLPTYVQAFSPRSLVAAVKLMRQVKDERGRGDGPRRWELQLLAVGPEAQGKGAGSALLDRGLQRLDLDGMPVGVESSTAGSCRLYERHGFEVVHRASWAGVGFPVTLLRPAAA